MPPGPRDAPEHRAVLGELMARSPRWPPPSRPRGSRWPGPRPSWRRSAPTTAGGRAVPQTHVRLPSVTRAPRSSSPRWPPPAAPAWRTGPCSVVGRRGGRRLVPRGPPDPGRPRPSRARPPPCWRQPVAAVDRARRLRPCYSASPARSRWEPRHSGSPPTMPGASPSRAGCRTSVGPGTTTPHAVATMTDRLREASARAPLSAMGWYATKHAVGIYGSPRRRPGFTGPTPPRPSAPSTTRPPGGDERRPGPAVVVAATVWRARRSAAAAPGIARLPDGSQVAAAAADALGPWRGPRGHRGPGHRSPAPAGGQTRRAALGWRGGARPVRLTEGEHHGRGPRAPGSRRDPHHQPTRGAQRHQRRRQRRPVRRARRARGRWRLRRRRRHRGRRQGLLRRHGPQGLRRRARERHHGGTGGFGGITQRHFPKPSSPRSTVPPWPGGARSCCRATSSWPPTTPCSASPRPSGVSWPAPAASSGSPSGSPSPSPWSSL